MFSDKKVVIISLDYDSKIYALELANKLRMNNYSAEIDYLNYSLKQQFKLSDRLNAEVIIIIGEDELKTKNLSVKNTVTKSQEKIKEEDLLLYLQENLK
jgi:histidyl-tRNA synthetase